MSSKAQQRREDAIALVRLAYSHRGSIDLWLIRIAHGLAPRVTAREVRRLEAIYRQPLEEEDSYGSSVR